jgi:G3E family GTPase
MAVRGAPLADIPVNVIVGRRGPRKAAFLENLLALRPDGEPWALLRNDGEKEPGAAPGGGAPGLSISQVADGCICCSAQVELRVALTRLLREARPRRLLLEPSSQAKLPEVLRLLADRWLAPVLSVRATLGFIDAADAAEPAEPWLSCDVLAVANATALKLESLRALWQEAAPGLRVVPADEVALADLDAIPRHPVRPLFRSGG